MKLADWARKQGISYLTAYRWFKDGQLPVKAYQSESGTIIVTDDAEKNMSSNIPETNEMSLFLKKTVEFSKNNSSIEDFAAYILSNFSLKLNASRTIDSPKYSKVKPSQEDIQKHFEQFFPKKEKPSIAAKQLDMNLKNSVSPELYQQYSAMLNPFYAQGCSNSYASKVIADNSINLDSLNLYCSTQEVPIQSSIETTVSSSILRSCGSTGEFKPTQKEIESATALKLSVEEIPSDNISVKDAGKKKYSKPRKRVSKKQGSM
jgi:hypothetical protein